MKMIPNPGNRLQLIIDIDLPTGKVQVKNVSGQPINLTFLASVFTKLADNNLDQILKQESMLIKPRTPAQELGEEITKLAEEKEKVQ